MQYCIFCMQEFEGHLSVCPHCGRSREYTVPEYHLRPGTVLSGKFEVGAALGEGGFGITYVGRDRNLDLKVAVKEYFPSGFVNRDATLSSTVSCGNTRERQDFFDKGRSRFLQEARTLAKFADEPGIVGIRDFFEENNTVYIVMEFLNGETLKDYLKTNGTLPPGKIYSMLLPVMEALKAVHKAGVIHRDISPDNIMITKKGLKLLDFGAARSTEGNKSLSVVLKHGYAPEEQYRSKGNQGPWTDVYSLCATIYKCITGNRPDESNQRLIEDEVKPPSALGITISPVFEDTIMKGMAVLQKNRWQSVDELMAGFERTVVAETAKEAVYTQIQPMTPPPVTVASQTAYTSVDKGFKAVPSLDGEPAYTGPALTRTSRPSFIITDERPYSFPNVRPGFGDGTDSIPTWKFYRGTSSTGIINFPHGNSVLSTSGKFTLALRRDGTVASVGQVLAPFRDIYDWRGLIAIASNDIYVAGLKNEGTVITVCAATGKTVEIKGWRDMVSVTVGCGKVFGLRSDGVVFGASFGTEGQRGIMLWHGTVAVSAGINHVLGLTADGRVTADGNNNYGQCNVVSWQGISAVSAGGHHSVGLRADGTVVAVGNDSADQCEVGNWRNVIAVSAGGFHTVALHSDGTVQAVGSNSVGQCEVGDWRDIIAIHAGAFHTVGLRSNGSLVACGNNRFNQCEMYGMKNIGLLYLKSPIRLPDVVRSTSITGK